MDKFSQQKERECRDQIQTCVQTPGRKGRHCWLNKTIITRSRTENQWALQIYLTLTLLNLIINMRLELTINMITQNSICLSLVNRNQKAKRRKACRKRIEMKEVDVAVFLKRKRMIKKMRKTSFSCGMTKWNKK